MMNSASIRYKQLEDGLKRSHALAIKKLNERNIEAAARMIKVRNNIFSKMEPLISQMLSEELAARKRNDGLSTHGFTETDKMILKTMYV